MTKLVATQGFVGKFKNIRKYSLFCQLFQALFSLEMRSID